MELTALLALSPDEVAKAVITRRHELNELLPDIVRERRKEVDYLTPLVDQVREERDQINQRVHDHKHKRNACHKEAKELRASLVEMREQLLKENRLQNPNPAWAKDKLAEKLVELDSKLETEALDLKTERKLLKEMKKAVNAHREWVSDRQSSDPEAQQYRDGWNRCGELMDEADANHKEMVELAKMSEELHKKFAEHRDVHKEAAGQLNRARNLLSQTDDIVSYWNHRIDKGFGDLKDGTGDLMAASSRVADGKPSSMPRKAREEPVKTTSGGEEE
jgi:uncharacterized coiled-coil DUF342 family protein